MTAPRFVAFLGRDDSDQAPNHVYDFMSRIALKAPIDLWATDHVLMLGDQGAVIGHLFTRSIPSHPITELNPAEINAALVTRGQSLIRDYWGGYVAIFRDVGGDLLVVRDPSGALPCGSACKKDPVMEWAPWAGQGHAADLTMSREFCCSNCAGLT